MTEITHGPTTIVKTPSCCDASFVTWFISQIDSTVADGSSEEIVVDLSQTTSMDSASMGTLLLLQERARAHGRVVALANADHELRRTLRLVQFDRIFKMRSTAPE